MGSDSSKVRRMQGCYVSDEEIERLTRYWRTEARLDEPDEAESALTLGIPAPLIQPELWEKMMGGEEGEGALAEERDVLWDDAVALIQNHRTASTSFLQRKLRVGYSRAARLLDALEQAGLVGPPQGNLGREVLIGAGDDPDEVAADYRGSLERAFEGGETPEGPEAARTGTGSDASARPGKEAPPTVSKQGPDSTGDPASRTRRERRDRRDEGPRDDGWDDW